MIASCSQDIAQRDIQDLIDQGILVKDAAGGRSTGYSLFEFLDRLERYGRALG